MIANSEYQELSNRNNKKYKNVYNIEIEKGMNSAIVEWKEDKNRREKKNEELDVEKWLQGLREFVEYVQEGCLG